MRTAPPAIRKAVRFGARAIVTMALLLLVFSRVDTTSFWQTVRAAQWRFLLGVWAFAAVFFWVQSVAMKLILRKQDCEVSLNVLFGASCITGLYSLVLPGILSTGVKWYILTRDTGKGSNVLSSMLYNQVTLSIVMTAIGLVGLIVTNPTDVLAPNAGPPWLLPLVCGAMLALLVLMCVLALNGPTGGAVIRLLAVTLAILPHAVRAKGHTMLTQIAAFQTAGWRFHLTIALIDAVDGVLVSLVIYLFAAKAAGVDAPIGVLIWLGAIVFLLGRIPISVANLGVREVTLVAFLAPYGVERSAALVMSMILFSMAIFVAAIGAVYQIAWSGRIEKGDREKPVRARGPDAEHGVRPGP